MRNKQNHPYRDPDHPDNHWKWTALVVVVFAIVAIISASLISQRNCMPTDLTQALQGECEFSDEYLDLRFED